MFPPLDSWDGLTHVVVGGTFEYLHRGHMKLLDRAAELNEKVTVGITADEFAQEMRRREVAPLDERLSAVESYLEGRGVDFEVKVLDDPYGDAVEADYDVIVVSPETRPVADEINERREERGKDLLRIVEVGFAMSDDDEPISATRIYRGEIDREGNLL